MSNKPRKIQLHSDQLTMWNYRGTDDFSAFAPTITTVLSNDVWLCDAAADVSLESGALIIRPGDLIIALKDGTADLTAFSSTSVAAGDWKIIRHLKDDELAWINEQMHPYVAPSGTCTGSETLEKSLQTADYTVHLAWTTTPGTNPITTKTLQKKIGGGAWTSVGGLSLVTNSGTETIDTPVNSDSQFRLILSSKAGETTYSSVATVTFQYKVYVAVDVANPVINDEWLHEASQTLWGGTNNTPYRTISGTLPTNPTPLYMFYCVPITMVAAMASNSPNPYLHPLYFKWDVGEGGFSVIADDIVYNMADAVTTEDYVIFRTNQSGLGAISINVTSTP